LRHVDAAREAYTRAARLRPTAQTPRIALSELARRSGDREAAMREMQVVSIARRASATIRGGGTS
jgi:hypothetical protein